MADELIPTIIETRVTVDAATADARGDNFVPTDDEPVLDNQGNSVDTTTAPAPAPAPAPAAPAPAPAPTADEADELERQNGGRIPKSRFNEVNNARKLAEERAALLAAEVERLKTQPAATAPAAPAPAPAPAAPAFDVDAQERAYADAMLEGNVDEALQIRKDINAHILTTARQEAIESVSANMTARQAATALQEASNKAVADFPYLNTAEGAETLDLIILARDRGIAQGKPAHVALQEAVAKIAPKFAPAQTPNSGLSANTPALDTRSVNAVARGAQDSNLQPPAIVNGIGNRATDGKIDVTQLTEEQFEKLSPEEKKKMRGD